MHATRQIALVLAILSGTAYPGLANDKNQVTSSAAAPTALAGKRQPHRVPVDEKCEPRWDDDRLLKRIEAEETRRIAQTGGLVSRRGPVVRLRLDNGRTLQFKDGRCFDRQDIVHTCAEYRFVAHFASQGFYVLHAGFWEERYYSMIDRRNGTETVLPAFPHRSPDGRHFATANSSPSVDDTLGVEVWSFTPGGPRREFRLENDDAHYCSLGWDGSERVKLRGWRFPMEQEATFPAEAVLTPEGWQVRSLGDAPR